MFDWDRFKNGKIAVHCDTEEKANDFLKECNKQGITWTDGDKTTEINCWFWYEKDTSYACRDGKSKLKFEFLKHYKDKGLEIIKWEIDKMKELTFKEVIANIKEGEVCESEEKIIQKISCAIVIGLKDKENIGSEMGFLDNVKYKLQRKEYTFQEAFKAYEEGKEIESKEFKYKKINGIDSFKLIREKYGWNECEDGFEIHLDEIRDKWYIND